MLVLGTLLPRRVSAEDCADRSSGWPDGHGEHDTDDDAHGWFDHQAAHERSVPPVSVGEAAFESEQSGRRSRDGEGEDERLR